MEYSIYKITNLINGKIYIGSTVGTVEERFRKHVVESNGRCKTYLHKSIKKHGKENFSIECIFNVLFEEDLNYYEDLFMDEYNSLDSKIGYNLVYADRGVGSREYISIMMKKEWLDPVKREKRLNSSKNIDRTKTTLSLINYNKTEIQRETKKNMFIEMWRSGEMSKTIEGNKKSWSDPEHKASRIEAMIEGSQKNPVTAVNINSGTLIRYESIHSAMRDGYAASSICNSLKKSCITGQKHVWWYDEGQDNSYFIEETLKLIGSFNTNSTRKVMSHDIKTGIKVIYSCISDVKLDGYEPKRINKVLKGERSTVDGKTWTYID